MNRAPFVMHILVFHQQYLSVGQPGGSRFNEFARLWSDAGHRVTVITGNLGYTDGKIPEAYRGKWIVHEMDGPVTVYRTHVPTTYHSGRLGRSLAYFGWVASSLTALPRVDQPDVIVATSPPLTACLPGWLAARARWPRTPWVFEVRDIWPDSLVTSGLLAPEGAVTKMLYALERFATTRADRVNVLTPAFRDDAIRRGLCPAEKVVFVPNGADVSMFAPAPRDNATRRAFGWGDRIVALYAGAHSKVNAIDQLVGTAERLRAREDLLIATVGEGTERARVGEEITRRGLKNLIFHGPVPKTQMPDVINAADIGMAVLQNNPMMKTVYPNKVFDYMACARPVVLAIDGVAREMVCDAAGAGIWAEAENPEAIADAIVRLADDPEARARMGASGRAWVLANATRESLATRYLTVFEEMLAARR